MKSSKSIEIAEIRLIGSLGGRGSELSYCRYMSIFNLKYLTNLLHITMNIKNKFSRFYKKVNYHFATSAD